MLLAIRFCESKYVRWNRNRNLRIGGGSEICEAESTKRNQNLRSRLLSLSLATTIRKWRPCRDLSKSIQLDGVITAIHGAIPKLVAESKAKFRRHCRAKSTKMERLESFRRVYNLMGLLSVLSYHYYSCSSCCCRTVTNVVYFLLFNRISNNIHNYKCI